MKKIRYGLEMGKIKRIWILDRETFSCSICLDLLKDPVMIPCGHSYCRNCITSFWDEGERKKSYHCPQCRKTFTPRPELQKSTMLAALVEQLNKTGLPAVPADHRYAGPEDVACDVCSGRKLKVFTQLIRLLQKRSSEVKQQIRSQQETEVSRVKDVQEKLEQEITELKRKDAELEQLSHTEDHNQFLLNYPSLPALSESTHSSSINIRPLRHFEDVTAAVSELREKLQDVLRDSWTNISLMVTEVDVLLSEPEPKSRAGFLRCSCEITLDPNTAHPQLVLSEGNKKAIVTAQHQSYSSHPDRFTYFAQVVSRESLTGRCYWEVEWSRAWIHVAVAYKNISRAGCGKVCRFGDNDKSWALLCYQNSFKFGHNDIWTSISGPVFSRLGVYLDHTSGILSFYSVSETMTLLHRVQTTFTQPLLAGVGIWEIGSSAKFHKPN
uniref:Tripartite motif-containing protein 16-like n=1 Tax=Poecilia latipinna TaxID=48699 RepID=A0A3B3TX85_9TELE